MWTETLISLEMKETGQKTNEKKLCRRNLKFCNTKQNANKLHVYLLSFWYGWWKVNEHTNTNIMGNKKAAPSKF